MRELTIEEILDYFLYTLHYLDERNLELSDDELLSIILEELDINVHSFLYHRNVERLIECKLIPLETKEITEELRNNLIDIIEHKRSVEQIRFDKDWIIARDKAKEILNIISKDKTK